MMKKFVATKENLSYMLGACSNIPMLFWGSDDSASSILVCVASIIKAVESRNIKINPK